MTYVECFDSKGNFRPVDSFAPGELDGLSPARRETFDRLREAVGQTEQTKATLAAATSDLAAKVRRHQVLTTRAPSTNAQREAIRRREWLAITRQRG